MITTISILGFYPFSWGNGGEGEHWDSVYISQYTWDKSQRKKGENFLVLPSSTLPSKYRIIMCNWHWRFPRNFPVHRGHIPCIVCSLSSNLAVEGRSWRQDNGDAAGPCIPVSSGDKDASGSEDLLRTRRLTLMSPLIILCNCSLPYTYQKPLQLLLPLPVLGWLALADLGLDLSPCLYQLCAQSASSTNYSYFTELSSKVWQK